MQFGNLGDDLIESRKDESIELNLTHWSIAAQRHADGGANDAGFSKGRIDHSMLAKVLLEAFGDPKDSAELADVLASDNDFGIGFQSSAKASIECLRHGQRGHQWTPPP
jgi:hypothetical protein